MLMLMLLVREAHFENHCITLNCPWTEHKAEAIIEDWSSGKEFEDGLELLTEN